MDRSRREGGGSPQKEGAQAGEKGEQDQVASQPMGGPHLCLGGEGEGRSEEGGGQEGEAEAGNLSGVRGRWRPRLADQDAQRLPAVPEGLGREQGEEGEGCPLSPEGRAEEPPQERRAQDRPEKPRDFVPGYPCHRRKPLPL